MEILESQRCLLKPLSERDYADIYKLYASTKVREFLGGSISKDKFKQKFQELLSSSLYQWVAKSSNEGKFIGLISLEKHHDSDNYEISYQIIESEWGKGFGFEITQEVISFGFNQLKLSKILVETQSKNESSIKMLEKLGMHLEKKIQRFGNEQSIYAIRNI